MSFATGKGDKCWSFLSEPRAKKEYWSKNVPEIEKSVCSKIYVKRKGQQSEGVVCLHVCVCTIYMQMQNRVMWKG